MGDGEWGSIGYFSVKKKVSPMKLQVTTSTKKMPFHYIFFFNFSLWCLKHVWRITRQIKAIILWISFSIINAKKANLILITVICFFVQLSSIFWTGCYMAWNFYSSNFQTKKTNFRFLNLPFLQKESFKIFGSFFHRFLRHYTFRFWQNYYNKIIVLVKRRKSEVYLYCNHFTKSLPSLLGMFNNICHYYIT